MANGSPHRDDETEDETEGKSGAGDLPGQLAAHARVLAVAAMKNAPWQARILVYVLYLIFGLSFVVLITAPNDAATQIILFALALISFVVLYKMMGKQDKRVVLGAGLMNPQKVDDIKKGSDISGMSLADYDRAVSLLNEIREKIFRCLSQKQNGISISGIRANVFLPQESDSGLDYVLNIYPGLHVNMNNVREREISFGPGEGLTGRVFEEGTPRVAERIPSEATGWDSTYTLTAEQTSRIHPKLQWILSLPLKHGKTPIGVLNIDGLQDIVHVDALYGCIRDVYYEVNAMQELLSRNTALEKVRT